MNKQSKINLCILALISCSVSIPVLANEPGNHPEQSAIKGKEVASGERQSERQAKRKLGIEIQINPDALRARLNKSIERAQKILESHEAALAKLDAGASPTQVLAELKMLGDPRGSSRKTRSSKGSDGHGKDSERMSPAERQRIQAFIKENFPDLHRNFQQVAQVNPVAADRLLSQMRPDIVEILMLEKRDPSYASIKKREMQIGLMFVEASQLYRKSKATPNASESEIQSAFDHMESVAIQRFDIRLEAKAYEISKLEARLNELKSSVESVKETRDAEVLRIVKSAMRSAGKSSSSGDD